MALNVPIGKISINWKIENSTNSDTTDLLSYQVKPYTTCKKVGDITPLALTNHFKIISSDNKVKDVEFPATVTNFLGLKIRVSNESPFDELKSFWDILSFHKYNPLGPLAFSWTFPALAEHNRPSLRYHEFTASMDTTTVKEISFDIKLGLGQMDQEDPKIRYRRVQLEQQQWSDEEQQQWYDEEEQWYDEEQQQSTQYNSFQLTSEDIDSIQVHPKRQKRVKQGLQQLQVQNGYGIALIYTLTLKGSQPWKYIGTISFAIGNELIKKGDRNLVKTKWNFNWENEAQRSSESPIFKICMRGYSDVPLLPMWTISDIYTSINSFRFNNELSMGSSSCFETSITVDGHAKVSNKQLEFSLNSEEARQCQLLLHQNVTGAKLSRACEKFRLQANSLDEIEFETTFHNVSEKQKNNEDRLVEVIKMLLWPNFRPSLSNTKYREHQPLAGSTFSTKTLIRFHQKTPSFDLDILRVDGNLHFANVHIPYPFNLVFPLKGGRNNFFLAARALTGNSFTPECKVDMKQITTFDNKTIPVALDDCFHLLSGDCSKDESFGILAKTSKSAKMMRELKVFLGDISITLNPSSKHTKHEYFSKNGTTRVQEIPLSKGIWTQMISNGKAYGHLYRSIDNVYQVKSDKYNVNFLYDGSRIVIYASNLLKNKLCGICGNFNQVSKDDILGPAACTHTNPEALVASYRLNSNECEALPKHVENQLKNDHLECHQIKQVPTQIAGALRHQDGKCYLR